IAREMAGRLADFGQKVAYLRHGAAEENGQADVFHADLTDLHAIDGVLKKVRQQFGAIAGLVHLLPLAEPAAAERSLGRMQREVKSLYRLARALGDDLRQAGAKGGALFLAATGLGGSFGFGGEPLPESYFAGHGGVVGFVKCLSFEWPEVLVRV